MLWKRPAGMLGIFVILLAVVTVPVRAALTLNSKITYEYNWLKPPEPGNQTNWQYIKTDFTLKYDFSEHNRLYSQWLTEGQLYENNTLSLTSKFNQLYVDLAMTPDISFKIGKQPINWGLGYYWSPAGFLNSTMDINLIRLGKEAVMADFNHTSGEYTFLAAREALDRIGYTARYKFPGTDVDAYLYGMKDFDSEGIGASIAGEVFGLTSHLEIGARNQDGQVQRQAVLGTNYSFANDKMTMVLIELFYNPDGYYEINPTNTNDILGHPAQKMASYLYLGLTSFLWRQLFLSVTSVYNNLDNSFMINSVLTYPLQDNIETMAKVYITGGGAGKEFTSMFQSQYAVGINFYF
jgi:hypothetical protein